MILTAKYRVKDRRSVKALVAHAMAVNTVWNFCVETQRKAERLWQSGSSTAKWPSHFTLTRLTSGVTDELGISGYTVGEVCRVFASARTTTKRAPKFRRSGGARRSLGWVPFRRDAIQFADGGVVYRKKLHRVFGVKRRPLPAAECKTGAFVEDARGRWFLTLQYEAPDIATGGQGEIGIDLGLKHLAACSDGMKIEAPQHFRKYERRLAVAQRAGNMRRAKAIHARIANARKDFLHKATTALVRENRLIVVGDVSSSKLAKTRFAKSVLDAGWTTFRDQLRYKASRHGAVLVVVDERNTSRTCSSCGCIPVSSPKGVGALGVRSWVCSDCGESHDRDINAARNILRIGRSSAAREGDNRRAA